MSLFDQLSGLLGRLSGNSNQDSAALWNGLVRLLGSGGQQGGLTDLVQGFQQNGLGDIVSQWIGTRICRSRPNRSRLVSVEGFKTLPVPRFRQSLTTWLIFALAT
jgi:hypothetical protein